MEGEGEEVNGGGEGVKGEREEREKEGEKCVRGTCK